MTKLLTAVLAAMAIGGLQPCQRFRSRRLLSAAIEYQIAELVDPGPTS